MDSRITHPSLSLSLPPPALDPPPHLILDPSPLLSPPLSLPLSLPLSPFESLGSLGLFSMLIILVHGDSPPPPQGTHKSLQQNHNAKSIVSGIIDGTGSMGAATGPLLVGVISDKSVSWWVYMWWPLVGCID